MARAQIPLVYKIVSRSEWTAANAIGMYVGSTDDSSDGYIHLSTETQLAETARKHFANKKDLLLIAIRSTELGPSLKWEPSRGGELFPHLYAALPTTAAAWVKPLLNDVDGIPDVLAALREGIT